MRRSRAAWVEAFLISAYLQNSEVRMRSTYFCSILAFRAAGRTAFSKIAPGSKPNHNGGAVLLLAVLN